MGYFEEMIKNMFSDNYTSDSEIKDFIRENVRNSQQNESEFVRLLPYMIQNTNEDNCHWIHDLKNYFDIPGLLDTYISHIFDFPIDKKNFFYMNLLCDIGNIPVSKQHIRSLIQDISVHGYPIDYYSFYYMLKRKYPDIVSEMLETLLLSKKCCPYVFGLFDRNHENDCTLIYKHIDKVIPCLQGEKIFQLRDMVEDNHEAYGRVKDEIDYHSLVYIKNTIKNIYLKMIINSYYVEDFSYLDSKEFDTILEVIYLIIKDICKNENVKVSDILFKGQGAYSSVIFIKDKVLKIGVTRGTKRFPNNPYINAMLLRKEFKVRNGAPFFIEVNERVDTESFVSKRELYHLYKRIRDLHLVWADVNKRNVGRLLRDNAVYWREELPITDSRLGLDDYVGEGTLKAGNIVILDNDLIYPEREIEEILHDTRNLTLIRYEKRYQKEKRIMKMK